MLDQYELRHVDLDNQRHAMESTEKDFDKVTRITFVLLLRNRHLHTDVYQLDE